MMGSTFSTPSYLAVEGDGGSSGCSQDRLPVGGRKRCAKQATICNGRIVTTGNDESSKSSSICEKTAASSRASKSSSSGRFAQDAMAARARVNKSMSFSGSSDTRSSCSDESALLQLQRNGIGICRSSESSSSTDNVKRQQQHQQQQQQARKRRLQQQRARKRRLQQQQQSVDSATSGVVGAGASKGNAGQKNKGSASNNALLPATKTSQQQQQQQQQWPANSNKILADAAAIVQQQQLSPLSKQAAAKRHSLKAAANFKDGEFKVGHHNNNKQQVRSSSESTTSTSSGAESTSSHLVHQQQQLNSVRDNNDTRLKHTTNNTQTNPNATSDHHHQLNTRQEDKQSSCSEDEEEQVSAGQIDILSSLQKKEMSFGSGSRGRGRSKKNLKSSSKMISLEIHATAAQQQQHTKRNNNNNQIASYSITQSALSSSSGRLQQQQQRQQHQTTTGAGANYSPYYNLDSSAIIDRLIIPAANLNLNTNNNRNNHHHHYNHHSQYLYKQQAPLFSPNYIEQQLLLGANFCCCWERDPNNQEFHHYHQQQPHYHDVSPPPQRPWIEKRPQLQQQHSFAEPTKRLLLQSDTNNLIEATTTPLITTVSQQSGEFSVLSYNVLCDRMAKPHYFPSAPYSALTWTYRRTKILEQLRDYNADIVALQELEMEHFESFFKPKLAELNYDGIFEPKSRVRTMDCLDMIRRVDGCAIFYKQNKFKLVQKHLLEFRRIAVANANGNQPMINRVMTKDNIGLATILELLPPDEHEQQQQINRKLPKQNNYNNKQTTTTTTKNKRRRRQQQQQKQILVCNTHIHWNPEDCDVKLIQTIMLMDELGSIARRHLRNPLSDMNDGDGITPPHVMSPGLDNQQQDDMMMPLILLGDFNSMPNSGVTDYLINGEISSLHKDFKDYRYSAIGSGGSINQLRRQSSPAWCNYPSSTNVNPTITSSSSTSSNFSPEDASPPSTPSKGIDSTTALNLLSSSPSTSTSSVDSACYSNSSSPIPVLNYSHPFKLTSAYERNIVPFTNYTQQFKAIIDYIFYSNESLQLLGLLGPLDKNWLKANQIRTLPQPHLPSDHLPLLVKFRLLNPATTTSPSPGRLIDGGGRFVMSKGDSNVIGTPTPSPIQSSLSNRIRQQHRPVVSSMRYNGTLHVSRPTKRQDTTCSIPNIGDAGGHVDNNNNNNVKTLMDNHQFNLFRQPKSKWAQHSRLTRTASYSPSATSIKYDQK